MNLQEEVITPLQDILLTNTAAVTDGVMGLVIVKTIVEDEAIVLLIATVAARGDTVKDRTESTLMITEDEVLETHVEDEVEMMKKILNII